VTTVFLDESGDLGFNLDTSATSRMFIITAVACADSRSLDKAVRKTFATFTKAEVRHHHGSLHAFKETPETRRRLLTLMAGLDVNVIAVSLEKRLVFTELASDPHRLYAMMVNALMNRLLANRVIRANDPVRLVASQRETQRLLNQRFVTSVMDYGRDQLGLTLEVDVRPAPAERGLQAADMASWTIFRKLEHGDATYAALLGGRLMEVRDVLG